MRREIAIFFGWLERTAALRVAFVLAFVLLVGAAEQGAAQGTQASQCSGAGWGHNNSYCIIPVKNAATDANFGICAFAGVADPLGPPCADIFGDPPDFPSQASHQSGTRYVYNCPAPLVQNPARTNCIEDCSLKPGHAPFNDICLPVQARQNCYNAGWSIGNNRFCQRSGTSLCDATDPVNCQGKCGLIPSDGPPDCTTVFGDPPVFPTSSGRYVYNCELADPLRVQSADRTECVCDSSIGRVESGGACVCAADRAEVDGQCLTCESSPNHHLVGGVCHKKAIGRGYLDSCPDGETLITGVDTVGDFRFCVLDELVDDVNAGKTACEAAGWNFLVFQHPTNDAICEVPIRRANGAEFINGHFCSFTDNFYSGNNAYQGPDLRCKEAFGDPLNFPPAAEHPQGGKNAFALFSRSGEWFYHSCLGAQIPSADLKSCVCERSDRLAYPDGTCPHIPSLVRHLCTEAGWAIDTFANWTSCLGPKHCDPNSTVSGDCGNYCNITAGHERSIYPSCLTAFDTPPVFPRNNSAERDLEIIRNCEGLTPPRVRSADRTECVCDTAAGYVKNRDQCVTLSGAEDYCRNAGWEVSVADGATVCNLPLLDVTNDARSSFCRLSAGGERRCADLFDGLQNIPRKVPNESISYVHNCLGIQRPTDDFKRCDCRNGNRYTYPNGDCPYKIPLIRHLCEQAGWSRDGHFCVGPKSCDAQATGGGRCDDRCFITREMESRAGRPSCHVFGERPPVFPHNNLLERDLQVIYNCPFPKVPGADRTECVCPERFKETPDGTCSFCGHNQVAGADGLSCVCDSAHAQTSTLPDGGPFCAPLVSCDFPFVPNHLGVSCNCAAGYELLDGACVDVDECKPESGNCAGPGQYGFGRSCYNREGGFACHDCEEGTGPTPDGRWCRDVNECALGTDTCGANGVCHNVVNTFSCGCEAGYVPGPGGSSRDPQCAVPDPDASPCAAAQASSCGAHASCHSFGEDGFSCSCDAGYASGNDGTSQSPQCRNVDECISGDVCGGNAQCSDAEGSYACECDAGFASGSPGDLQRPQCGDVDECALRMDSCGSGQACENTFGSYECVTCTTGSAPNAHRTDCAPIFAGTPPPPGVPVAALLPAVRVLLKWLPPTNLGGGVITRYEVLREEDESDGFVFLSSVAAAFTGGPSFTDLEPPFGATVRYKVRAVNFDLSLGALSEASEAVAIPPDVYTEANCLAKGGSWGRIASRPGNEHHAAADTCTVGGGTCFMNPEANFDSGASAFYEADGVSRGVHEYPVSGWCLDAWPLDCSPKILADPDNPFGGCIAYDCPSGHEANRTRTACEDVDECARGTHECAAGVGVCANTTGAYACGCGEGYSGDGYICTADKRVSLLAAANGSLSADPAGATVSHGTTVTFTAAPASGYEVSVWLADCAGSSGLECALTLTVDVSVGVEFSDIDECATETHSCAAAGGECTNTAGAYSCDCVSGYSGDGYVCESDKRVSLLAAANGSLSADPDRATVSHGTTVTFTAAPASGYEVSVWLADCAGASGLECALTVTLNVSVGVKFSDINECATGAHACASSGGVCANTAGAYSCGCGEGYSGDGSVCESDKRVSLLSSANGSLSADPAEATVSHGTTVTFTAAPDLGYEVSVWLADCAGSLGLECALTVTVDVSVGVEFSDINECATGTHSCAAEGGECANTAGSYDCNCVSGYSGDGSVCEADKRVSLLAAANGSLSADPAEATVSHGTTVTFTAAPDSGYEVSVWLADCAGASGLECALTVTMNVSVGVEFSDIDECATDAHSCASEGGECTNTAGAYSCGCVSGYSGDGSVCESDKRVSLLAVANGSLSASPAGAMVSHGTTVTFTAAPASGYEVSVWLADCAGSSGLECALTVTVDVSVGVEFSDIDECALETHSCASEGGVCANTAGAYSCSCVSGYSGDGSVCEADKRVSLLAAANGNLSASPDRAAVSHGTTVTFTAAPASGYEVSVWLADCAGSSGLECALTVTVDVSVGVEFSDIDECALETHSCAAEGGVCANTAGAYDCDCVSGYSGDGSVCESDKRVSLLASANGSLSASPAEATVSHGTTVTFTAAPASGYEVSVWLADCVGSSGLECALTLTVDVSVGVEFSDIDECATDAHSCAAEGGECTNTAGAYSCDCVSGYSGDGSVCESDKRVSLLAAANGNLSASPAGSTVSHGTTVTFTAAPDAGYEVSVWLADCAGASGLECALTVTLDVSVGVEFSDIDECATDAHSCAAEGGVCANTAGAYSCDCVSGYSGDGSVCESDKRVSLLAAANGNLSASPAGSTVSHGTTVTFTAAPDAGYEVSVWLADCAGASGLECALTVTLDVSVGVEFSDIDECATGTHSCASEGGECANTAGSYDCDCVSGYSGDGSVCESDKRVSLLASANGSLSASPDRATVSHGTTVTFTAAPASGYEVSVWLADCVGSLGLECALTLTVDVSVGVEFSDIDECALETHSCASEGGVCANTAGGYDCDCVSGYSGDGSVCESDKRVSLLAATNGSLSTDPAESTVAHGTTVTFTAAPASGYEVSIWLVDCAGSSGLECALTVTLDVSVGVEFSDIDECALEAHSCAADGGVCTNTAGAYSCDCVSGYSGDGYVCESDKRVSLLATMNGSLSADPAEAMVPHGTTVTFTAAPASGYEVSVWLADCAGSSGLECALTVTLDVSVGVEFSDIDECALETHSCAAAGGECANTAGAYSCDCVSGYSGDGSVCESDKRISLLASANGSLSADPAEATVTHGTTVTFTAAPASGYEVSVWLADCAGSSGLECVLTVTLDVSVGVEFSDINECALETHSCAAAGGECTNMAGSYDCDCVSGYSGDGSVCEADKRVSLLAVANGSLSASPDRATVSHGTTVTFTAAPASGYEVSVWLADCAGSLGLECALTLTLDVSVGVEFADIDECALETHSCASEGGVCANTAGSYSCSCVSGYSGDGSVCESDKRVSLLATANGSLSASPDRATVSHGTTVTFTAAPASGYEVSVWLADCVGASGLECALTVTVDVSVGVEFSDIDECATGTHACASVGGECANTAGAYSCDCVLGYSGNGYVCEVDKRVSLLASANGSLSASPAGAVVSHGTTVTFTAAPASGYEVSVWLADCVGSSGLECALTVTVDVSVGVEFSDIDECALETHSCAAAGGVCTNTAGAYSCDCGEGYSGDGSVCESDKRVSLLSSANGSLSASPAEAVVSHGTTVTFTAAPASGYEVSVWLADCAGSSGLECALTVTLDVSVGVEFSDIDECALETHSCAAEGGVCTNTAGSYDCDCVSGYAGDGSVCESDKRVSLLASANGSLSADPNRATVSHGTTVTFTAAPASGYEVSVWLADCAGASGLECALTLTVDVSVGVEFSDIDECATGTHSCAAAGGVCTNTAGAYSCDCVSGYSGDGFVCESDKRVSLLASANGSLSADPAEATVSHGTTVTFTAAPASGYEVSVWLADCAGSSGLECALTLTVDVSVGVEFSDIDECATGTHSCAAAGGVCTNTAGAYSCDCVSGYSGDGSVCESDKRVSLLAVANGSLSADPAGSTVSHGTTVTFTAAPASGYEVSVWLADCAGSSGLECALTVTLDVSVGVEFSDINECATGTHSCASEGGECTNTAGAYSCNCVSGYSGDGSVCESDKRVSLLSSANGSLSADPAGAMVSHGTTVTFTAAPDSGYEFSLWLADCIGAAGRECVLTVTMNVSVGAMFADIDECATGAHDCANPGGRCENIPGGFQCECAAGFSGDGKTCEADKKVFLLPLAGGALAAGRAGDPDVKDGEAVPHGATVTFVATPNPGHHVSGWTGKCLGGPVGGHDDEAPKTCEVTVTQNTPVAATFADTDECDAAAGVNAHDCGANSFCRNEPGDFRCECADGFYQGAGRACEANENVCAGRGMFFDGEKCVAPATCSGGKVLDPSTNKCICGADLFDDQGACVAKLDCSGVSGASPDPETNRECVCDNPAELISLDGTACEAGRALILIPVRGGGTLSAGRAGDAEVLSGERVPRGALLTITATPAPGHHVYEWTNDCEESDAGDHDDEGFKICTVEALREIEVGAEFRDTDECDAAAAATNAHNCGDNSVCANTVGGFDCACAAGFYSETGRFCAASQTICVGRDQYFDGTKCADCDEVPETEPNAVGDKCVCKTDGHLIFGDASNRRCASPVICPSAEYAGGDCVPHPRDGRKLDAGLLYSPSTCEKIFGGLLEDEFFCSEIDLNDTFCLTTSAEALPCAGLYEHVRLCNSINRPALDPWHCGKVCEDGKMARGRKCETAEQN